MTGKLVALLLAPVGTGTAQHLNWSQTRHYNKSRVHGPNWRPNLKQQHFIHFLLKLNLLIGLLYNNKQSTLYRRLNKKPKLTFFFLVVFFVTNLLA